MQQKTLIAVVIGALIILAGAWFYFSGGESPALENPSDPADLAARVNGEEITRVALETSKLQIVTAQNIDVASLSEEDLVLLNTQALDSLINNSLVNQAAKKDKVKVSDKEVDTQMEVIKGQFESAEAFQSALLEQGMSEEVLRSQVSADLVIQKYLEKALNLKSITVTEEEIQTLYDQESAANEETPALSEIGGQIEAFILQQKQQELLVAHIQELRADADIEVLN